MKYTKTERKSDTMGSFSSSSPAKQSNVMTRTLMLFFMTLCLLFAGAQFATTNAGQGCEFVCGDPFIDPNDGQCYQICCPADEKCMQKCEMRPCKIKGISKNTVK